MKKVFSVRNFLTGIIVIAIGTYFYGLNATPYPPIQAFEALGQFILMAIICTGGIGALLIIPAIFLTGAFTNFFIKSIFRNNQKIQQIYNKYDKESIINSSKNEQAIIEYIISCRREYKNIKDSTIKEKLLEVGWTEKIIEKAFAKCDPKSII